MLCEDDMFEHNLLQPVNWYDYRKVVQTFFTMIDIWSSWNLCKNSGRGNFQETSCGSYLAKIQIAESLVAPITIW